MNTGNQGLISQSDSDWRLDWYIPILLVYQVLVGVDTSWYQLDYRKHERERESYVPLKMEWKTQEDVGVEWKD